VQQPLKRKEGASAATSGECLVYTYHEKCRNETSLAGGSEGYTGPNANKKNCHAER